MHARKHTRAGLFLCTGAAMVAATACGSGSDTWATTDDLISVEQSDPDRLGHRSDVLGGEDTELRIEETLELSQHSAQGYLAAEQAELDRQAARANLNPRGTKYDLDCYEAHPTCSGCTGDFDNDGYVDSTNPVKRTFQRWLWERLTCPSGWVKAKGDCDDSDAAVHPARAEVERNGKDDDCDGRTDEWEYLYHANGFGNGDNQFDVVATINDLYTALVWAFGYEIYVKLEYGKLYQYPSTSVSGYIQTTVDRTELSDGRAIFTLRATKTGLSNATIYRSRIHSVYMKSGTTYTEIPYTRVGEWYYTSTNRSDNSVSRARTKMLLQGFNEYYYQMIGLVGFTGSLWINGTRYRATEDELWRWPWSAEWPRGSTRPRAARRRQRPATSSTAPRPVV